MKRSEANQVIALRNEFSTRWPIVSSKDNDSYFSRNGCDCCQGLACNVYEVDLVGPDLGKGPKPDRDEGQICGGCLCSLINGDDSDLDYSVTEEDV